MTPEEKVSKDTFNMHIENCKTGWKKVDDMYELLLKLRLRTYLIIGFLAGASGYTMGKKDAAKAIFAALFGSLG